MADNKLNNLVNLSIFCNNTNDSQGQYCECYICEYKYDGCSVCEGEGEGQTADQYVLSRVNYTILTLLLF